MSYLDGTIFNIQSKITDFDDLSTDFASVIIKDDEDLEDSDRLPQQPLTDEISRKLTTSSKFQKLRYLSRLHLQLGAVLSQINKHEEALYHGKTAALYCQDLIRNTELLCRDYLEKISLKAPAQKGKKAFLKKPLARENIDKLHKFESKEKPLKSPSKPLLKSKEEGQVLGLPQEDKKVEKDDLDDEPSIYFYEDDEDELETLVRKCLPILSEMLRQINNFDKYNGMKEFKQEHHFQHTLIKDISESKRSSLGVRKLAKKANSRSSQDHNSLQLHKDYHTDLCKMQETVTGLLGVKRYEDWILNLNIGNVMHLSPLGLQEMNLQLDNSHELTRDALLEKVVLLSIAYF